MAMIFCRQFSSASPDSRCEGLICVSESLKKERNKDVRIDCDEKV